MAISLKLLEEVVYPSAVPVLMAAGKSDGDVDVESLQVAAVETITHTFERMVTTGRGVGTVYDFATSRRSLCTPVYLNGTDNMHDM